MGNKRILIVEDNPDTADSLAALLESYGHTVAVAYTGPEGLAAASASKPDIAIVDIGLPGMDGHELARQLRRQLNGADCLLAPGRHRAQRRVGIRRALREARAAGSFPSAHRRQLRSG
jgi:CheY-like chemotaxis protein